MQLFARHTYGYINIVRLLQQLGNDFVLRSRKVIKTAYKYICIAERVEIGERFGKTLKLVFRANVIFLDQGVVMFAYYAEVMQFCRESGIGERLQTGCFLK